MPRKPKAPPPLPDRNLFAAMYAEGPPPWDIERPQEIVERTAANMKGSLLDVGCGTGEHALFFAARGQSAVGVDYCAAPLVQARQKAAERSLNVPFLEQDALAMTLETFAGLKTPAGEPVAPFDTILDSGLFHGLSKEDMKRYSAVLANLVKPGGWAFVLCFNENEPGNHGPGRMSRWDLHRAFDQGWGIVAMLPTRFEVRDDTELEFTDGGAHAWLVSIQRNA
jgi:cyclopropane fatty-acyl-phospholipid synthase-like methyltransferase